MCIFLQFILPQQLATRGSAWLGQRIQPFLDRLSSRLSRHQEVVEESLEGGMMPLWIEVGATFVLLRVGHLRVLWFLLLID